MSYLVSHELKRQYAQFIDDCYTQTDQYFIIFHASIDILFCQYFNHHFLYKLLQIKLDVLLAWETFLCPQSNN